jgi:hypothetical protein
MTHRLVNHHIPYNLVLVLTSTEQFMRCLVIANPATCKINAVINFLQTKNISVAEICHELHVVYSRNVISEETVRQWCRNVQMFNMKSEVVGHLQRVMILFKVLMKKKQKHGASQLQNFSVNFHKFHALFSTRWVSKLLTGTHKMQRMTSALTPFFFLLTAKMAISFLITS